MLRKNLLYILSHSTENQEYCNVLECFYLAAESFPDSSLIIIQSNLLQKLYMLAPHLGGDWALRLVCKVIKMAVPSLT